MTGYTSARKSKAKTQRRNEAPRATAQGRANLGGGKARRATARSEIPSAPAQVIAPRPVPERPASQRAERHYLAREHVRRDIGSRVRVLYLRAADAPHRVPEPQRDAEGVLMYYIVDCVTHGSSKHFRLFATACRAAKASHQWCPQCKSELVHHHRLHTRPAVRPRQI
ncbi:MAG TPA: hypothetical protein VGI64_23045 [Streptosporangiaceae bacterium]